MKTLLFRCPDCGEASKAADWNAFTKQTLLAPYGTEGRRPSVTITPIEKQSTDAFYHCPSCSAQNYTTGRYTARRKGVIEPVVDYQNNREAAHLLEGG